MNPDIKNLRVAVVSARGTNINQRSTVEEILACPLTELIPITDFFQAQNDNELPNAYWSFLINIKNNTDITGTNIDGIHQFDEVIKYGVKYWKNASDYRIDESIVIREDYNYGEAFSVGNAIAELCHAYLIYEVKTNKSVKLIVKML